MVLDAEMKVKPTPPNGWIICRKGPVRGGFEPPVRFYPYNGLANRRFRPLSHRTSGEKHKKEYGQSPTAILRNLVHSEEVSP